MTTEEDQCKKIFQELVDKGYILASKKVEESGDYPYFHAYPPDIILYNPDMKKINENSITFCLLHEENHNRLRPEFKIFTLFSVILAIFVFTIHPILIIIAICIMILYQWLEELRCDEFATVTIKNELKFEEQLSEILKKTLEIMPYKNLLTKITHPCQNNRVRNIVKRFDDVTPQS